MFYSAMEDFNIELQVNEEFQTIQFEPFTLIGATTNLSKLTKPMRDRFYHVYKLEYYSISELEKIIEQMASLKNNSIEKDACFEIAIRSKKTPRVGEASGHSINRLAVSQVSIAPALAFATFATFRTVWSCRSGRRLGFPTHSILVHFVI